MSSLVGPAMARAARAACAARGRRSMPPSDPRWRLVGASARRRRAVGAEGRMSAWRVRWAVRADSVQPAGRMPACGSCRPHVARLWKVGSSSGRLARRSGRRSCIFGQACEHDVERLRNPATVRASVSDRVVGDRREQPDAEDLRRPHHRQRAALADRKSTRLNSSHEWISYAVFCLKKKKKKLNQLLAYKKKKSLYITT